MEFDTKAILAITRPKDSLFTYYMLSALMTLFAAPIMLPYMYFRFHTMRYKFDEEGVSMSWGILFHHQIVLNYSRIQDIHLQSNFVERYLGLARLEIQTASGGVGAEMTLEGLDNVEQIRDFLYSRMRGAKENKAKLPPTAAVAASGPGLEPVLREIATELRAIREKIEAR